MSRLFLRFPEPLDHADGQPTVDVEWLILGDDGAAVAEGCTPLDDLHEVTAQCEPWVDDPVNVVVFIATSEALALSCQVPGRDAAQLRRAAPYAVEEFVTEDIETMHVACGALVRNEPVRCLVVPRDGVAGYLACLEHAGIRPGWMTTDAMALPAAPDLVTILYVHDTALVRTIDQTASVDLANLPAVLDAVKSSFDSDQESQEGQEGQLRQINGTLSDLHLTQMEFAPKQVENLAFDSSLLAYLAGEFDTANVINLLQGDFTPKRASSGPWVRWRAVAAGAGGWLAVALALLAAEGIWATYKADALVEEAKQLYRDIYDVKRVPGGNPAARMRFQLGQAPAPKAGFHYLLGNLGTSLQELAGRYELTNLSYSERSGLGAEVIVQNYDAVEALKNSLAQRGVELEVVSAEQEQKRVRTSLRIIEAG